MTETETGLMMGAIKKAYPNVSFGENDIEKRNSLALWYKHFKDIDAKTAQSALDEYIATDELGFPPKIGQLRGIIKRLAIPYSSSEVTSLVLRAASNGVYHYKEEWERLPEFVKDVVGTAGELYRYAQMNEENIRRSIKSKYKEVTECGDIRQKDRGQLTTSGLLSGFIGVGEK